MNIPVNINTVTKADNLVQIRNIIISTADKSGLEIFVPALISHVPNVQIFSTGGTFIALKDAIGKHWEKNLQSVSAYTGQPEMQGGLVKTLDFKIYLGLLSETYNREHKADLSHAGATEFDMVIGNLYPFRQVIANENATLENARGNIDIGGPCMLRAAAKNYLRVAAVCDPADYDAILTEIKTSSGSICLSTRFRCAQKAFKHTAEYDAAIADYLGEISSESCIQTYETGT